MKKYEAVVREVFEVFTRESRRDTKDFTIDCMSPEPMKIFVWLEYGIYKTALYTDITLDDGDVYELSLKLAVWLRDIDWQQIRDKYAKWEELNSDL